MSTRNRIVLNIRSTTKQKISTFNFRIACAHLQTSTVDESIFVFKLIEKNLKERYELYRWVPKTLVV